MATITRFEDIQAWKTARVSTRLIYEASSSGEFNRDFALRDQIRRAAISTMSNIAEGFEREGNKEFVSFLSIAKASCAETRAQLYVALDCGYVSKSQFDQMYAKLEETGRLIGGFMRYLLESDIRGRKFIDREPETRNVKLETK